MHAVSFDQSEEKHKNVKRLYEKESATIGRALPFCQINAQREPIKFHAR